MENIQGGPKIVLPYFNKVLIITKVHDDKVDI